AIFRSCASEEPLVRSLRNRAELSGRRRAVRYPSLDSTLFSIIAAAKCLKGVVRMVVVHLDIQVYRLRNHVPNLEVPAHVSVAVTVRDLRHAGTSRSLHGVLWYPAFYHASPSISAPFPDYAGVQCGCCDRR